MTTYHWIPVAPSQDIRPAENIVAGFAGPQELALWRSQEGLVQAWENRCPHRGMRFTLGRILDGRLSCAYHGWQFDAEGGRCSSVPAHPGMPVPKNVCATTYPVVEAQGMVWVATGGLGAQSTAPSVLPAGDAPGQYCRTLSVLAGATRSLDVLATQGFVQKSALVLCGPAGGQMVTVFANEVSNTMTLLHFWRAAELSTAAVHALMASLRTLRTSIESGQVS